MGENIISGIWWLIYNFMQIYIIALMLIFQLLLRSRHPCNLIQFDGTVNNIQNISYFPLIFEYLGNQENTWAYNNFIGILNMSKSSLEFTIEL